jgi:hypothetical protein
LNYTTSNRLDLNCYCVIFHFGLHTRRKTTWQGKIWIRTKFRERDSSFASKHFINDSGYHFGYITLHPFFFLYRRSTQVRNCIVTKYCSPTPENDFWLLFRDCCRIRINLTKAIILRLQLCIYFINRRKTKVSNCIMTINRCLNTDNAFWVCSQGLQESSCYPCLWLVVLLTFSWWHMIVARYQAYKRWTRLSISSATLHHFGKFNFSLTSPRRHECKPLLCEI